MTYQFTGRERRPFRGRVREVRLGSLGWHASVLPRQTLGLPLR
jgi:hypothetical protein